MTLIIFEAFDNKDRTPALIGAYLDIEELRIWQAKAQFAEVNSARFQVIGDRIDGSPEWANKVLPMAAPDGVDLDRSETVIVQMYPDGDFFVDYIGRRSARGVLTCIKEIDRLLGRPNVIKVDDRQLYTILAALRFYQVGALESIASNDGEVEPLDQFEIDLLCETINAGYQRDSAFV